MLKSRRPKQGIILFICFIFLSCTVSFSQHSLGFETNRIISKERPKTAGNLNAPLFGSIKLGLVWTRIPKRDFLNRFKFDLGVSIISMPGIREANGEFDTDRAFQFPIGIGLNSARLFESKTELILGMKYLPSYWISAKQYSHALQYDLGISRLRKSRDVGRKDKRFDIVIFAMHDITSVENMGISQRFGRVGLAFRYHIVTYSKTATQDDE